MADPSVRAQTSNSHQCRASAFPSGLTVLLTGRRGPLPFKGMFPCSMEVKTFSMDYLSIFFIALARFRPQRPLQKLRSCR